MTKRNPTAADPPSSLRAWRGKRIVILGDMILDEFIYGRSERVSREAPVVIVRYDDSAYMPGGGANAAQNVAALGGTAVPIGVVGADEAAAHLTSLLRDRGVSVRGLIAAPERVTTAKIRVMAGDYHAQRQQIVRIDKERRHPLPAAVERKVLDAFKREIAAADAVILSDYHQDLFRERVIRRSIDLCRATRVPAVADSRFRLSLFTGVTAATPNEVEASHAVGAALNGEIALERVGRSLLRRLSAMSVLVTRGRFGMSLFQKRRRTRSVDVLGSSEATDVTGAGDTVVSVIALALAAGIDMPTAMILANAAAARVVMKRGTAVTSVAEIEELLGGAGHAGGSVGM